MNSLIRKTLAIALCAWAVTASADNGVWTKRNTARNAIPAVKDGTPLKRLATADTPVRIAAQRNAVRSEAGTAREGFVTVISEDFNKMTSGADARPTSTQSSPALKEPSIMTMCRPTDGLE